jgi:NAD+--asparagine ADP-ribosyltransferase
MAYMSQERKSAIAPVIKAICKKYNIKASLAVRHHSTLVLNIKQGAIDFIGNFNKTVDARPGGFRNGNPAKDSIQVNTYWYHEHFSGKAKQFLEEVIRAMNSGNHDNSDIQTDYFDVGWYVDVNIGKWNQPYALVK